MPNTQITSGIILIFAFHIFIIPLVNSINHSMICYLSYGLSIYLCILIICLSTSMKLLIHLIPFRCNHDVLYYRPIHRRTGGLDWGRLRFDGKSKTIFAQMHIPHKGLENNENSSPVHTL